ncbi:ribonuclease H-like domain-containing protein [Tanacetum coccineum]
MLMAGLDDDIPPPPPPPQTQTPTQQTPHTVSTIKLLILKKEEYDIWAMKMEHYLAHIDYPIWEVIQRGNGHVSVSTDTNGVIKVLPPKTIEEILARERERKARTTLLMDLTEDHLAKFHKLTDAKEMWEAIKSRFGGNDESKKMQKYILKQQFKGFSVSNSEGLHKGYDRFQSLLSLLEIHGAGVSTEDANQKILRVFESTVKGSTASSSSTQNVAFVSENTSSTNDVSTAYGVSNSSGHNSQCENPSSYSFLANQSSCQQLDHEDLEQLDEFDLEEMDLKWQVAMISMRMKKFYKKTELCRLKRNQDSRRRENWNTGNKDKENGRRSGKQEDSKALVTLDGEGSDTEVTSCSKECKESYAKLKKLYDEQWEQLGDAKAEKEKEDLKAKVEKWHNSSKNLNILLNSQGFSQREIRLVWNNVQRMYHQNQFVPKAVLTRTGKIPVNTTRTSGTNTVNTARHNFNSQEVPINAARKVNTVKPIVHTAEVNAVSAVKGKGKLLFKVLVTKPQNKTPYEIVTGKIPIISYIRPFGCHVTILNTIDHMGKFDGKSDDRFLVGYSLQSKAFGVYNLESKRVEENLHITFLENKPNVVGKGPTWLFDLDYLTDSMNYQPVRLENQANKHACPQEANQNEGTDDNIDAGDSKIEAESAQDYFVLPIWSSYTSTVKSSKGDAVADFTNLEPVVNVSPIPTSWSEAIWIFLAFASCMWILVYQMDVKSAFCMAIDEEGFMCLNLQGIPKVVKLSYGLHQLPEAMSGLVDLDSLLDSEYVEQILDRKSHNREVLSISWQEIFIFGKCKKATIVATSTTEAEYVAAANCCGQVLWIQNQMLDYGFNFMNTKIYIDNESTICIVKNPVYHSKTKHIAIRHHFIRDAYEKKLIQVLKIHTDDNVADLLTKAFDVSRFQFLVVTIGMINP